MSEQPRSGRKKVARLSAAVAAVAALVVLGPWRRCQGMLGLGGGTGGISDTDPGKAPGGGSAKGDVAPRRRCQVRLSATGATVDDRDVDVDAVVKACKDAGAADVVVTGDAAQGAWDALRDALSKAGVEIYVRGAPDSADIDAGAR
jgi:hypothetical protein